MNAYAAKGTHGVASPRITIGLEQRGSLGNAAWREMLDDNACGNRVIELAHRSPRGIGIEIVVVAQLLALQLLGRGKGVLIGLGSRPGNAHALALVERGLLMGVLAIA